MELLKKLPHPLRVKRLIYNCRKRGILENELILSSFVAAHPPTPQNIELFEELLLLPDWTLYKHIVNPPKDHAILNDLNAFIKTKHPMMMPSLKDMSNK